MAQFCQQSSISNNERLDRMIELRQTLDGLDPQPFSPIDAIGSYLFEIRQLIDGGMSLDDWPLITACCERSLQIFRHVAHQHVENINDMCLLSKAYRQMGLFAEAENCLQNGLLEYYRDQSLLADYRQCLQAKRHLPAGWEMLRCGRLLLTPLRSCHEKDFFWQYSDNIAELCAMPDFNDDGEDWHQWLSDNQRRPTSHVFAINHLNWGFIGSAGIDVVGDVGFIFYWLGTDFQGHGFAPQAVRLLLNWAEHHLGMRCCYAIIYNDNQPSKKALHKLDFRPLPLKVADTYTEDYEQEYVYYRGPYRTDRQLFFELNQFFIDIDWEHRVLPLAGSSGWISSPPRRI